MASKNLQRYGSISQKTNKAQVAIKMLTMFCEKVCNKSLFVKQKWVQKSIDAQVLAWRVGKEASATFSK